MQATEQVCLKTLPRGFFLCNGCIFYDGARRTKLSIYKVLLFPVIFAFAFAISCKKYHFFHNKSTRQEVFQHICIVGLQNKKGI